MAETTAPESGASEPTVVEGQLLTAEPAMSPRGMQRQAALFTATELVKTPWDGPPPSLNSRVVDVLAATDQIYAWLTAPDDSAAQGASA